MERINPLNDYIFLKIMGEKGDEVQLLAFLNAVLKRPKKEKLKSVEIIENKSLPADIIGGKSCVLDVLAVLENGDKVNIEVQLRNLGNMDRRSLYYWSREFVKGLSSGHEYQEVPNVIAINVVGYEFLPQVPDFHTIFHIWEDRYREIKLTDALEIHFIDMVKFRSLAERDINNDSLHRWLSYLDPKSPKELVEEVIKMDIAIQNAETKLRTVTQDEESLRLYEIREKAIHDWTSGLNHAKREGRAEGRAEGAIQKQIEIAKNLLSKGFPIDLIYETTGLDTDAIRNLRL
jgi:predicted transposase/invertase (TIGR01784 family)